MLRVAQGMGVKPRSSDVKLEEEDDNGDDGGDGDGNDTAVTVIMTMVAIMTNTQPSRRPALPLAPRRY